MKKESKVKAVFPEATITELSPFYRDAAAHASLDTAEKRALFWANIGHETNRMTRMEENLNYTSARLAAVWPRRFSVYPKQTPIQPNRLAKVIGGNPESIANFAYSNRLGNGNPESGDGWKYRGRGLIQVTGKFNYQKFDQFMKMNGELVENPDLMFDPKLSLMCAAWFWRRNELNWCIDLKDIDKTVECSRMKINGSTRGFKEVRELYIHFIYLGI